MRVESEFTTVGKYFNETWQAGLARFFGVSVDTKVRNLWVVDNPASSYQFQERIVAPSQVMDASQTTVQYTDYTININWNWFSPDDSTLSKIRVDYHADDDMLYILNQEQRRQSRTVSDVLKPPTVD